MIFLKKYLLLVGLFANCISTFAQAGIERISSLSEIDSQLKSLDENSLVVFDVDEVIFTDADAIFRPVGDQLRRTLFNERYMQAQSDQERAQVTETLSIPLKMVNKILVEPLAPQLIALLQKRGIKVVALTSCPLSSLGCVESGEAQRLKHLADFSIQFDKAFPAYSRFTFESMRSRYMDPPIYNQGVIFSNGYSKSEVLSVFFKEIEFVPNKVIFIDDMFANLKDVESMLEEQSIAYHGFYYLKAHREPSHVLDEKKIRFQFDYLFKNQKWISDKQVNERVG